MFDYDSQNKNKRQPQAVAQAQTVHPSVIQRHSETGLVDNNESSLVPVQRTNHTGLPDNLKSGMEALSGRSLDHVRVHYNSSKPAAVQAHAFAQGSEIHLASGQEKHLPHELGHVVQQAEGRVHPTTTVGGVSVNDHPGLEQEATLMGERALRRENPKQRARLTGKPNTSSKQPGFIQRVKLIVDDRDRDLMQKGAAMTLGNEDPGTTFNLMTGGLKGLTDYQLQENEDIVFIGHGAIGDQTETVSTMGQLTPKDIAAVAFTLIERSTDSKGKTPWKGSIILQGCRTTELIQEVWSSMQTYKIKLPNNNQIKGTKSNVFFCAWEGLVR